MTLSRVPGKVVGSVAAITACVLVAVPGLMAIEMSSSSVRPAHSFVAGLLAVVSLFGLVECLRRVVLGCRWRFPSEPWFEIADVCSFPSGTGSGRRLLVEVCEAADRASFALALRVCPSNGRVVQLYEQLGFNSTGGSQGRRLACMTRCPVPSPKTGVSSRRAGGFVVVGGLLFGVVLMGFWSTNAGLLETACVGCGLGALVRGTAIDLREHRLPNFWTAVGFVSGFAGSVVATSGVDAVLGVVVATVPFLLIHLLDPKALGFGDVKYAGAAGSIVAVVWWPAAILMVVVALTTSLIGRVVRQSGPRAFGPYLMAGTLVASLAATTLVSKGLVA